MQEYFYRIADFDVHLRMINVSGNAFEVPAQYRPFEVPASESLLFRMDVDNLFAFPERGEEIGQFDDSGHNQAVYRQADGGYQFELSNVAGQVVCRMATDEDFANIKISLRGTEADYVFGLNNAMMIAFAFSSARRGALLMHASVTLLDGFGHLFLGKSGTGKSTHSQLWIRNFDGAELLNDDNPVVRVQEGEVLVYGSPWSGKTPCYRNLSAPVKALVMLEQKPYNQIRRQSVVESLASLLSSTSSMVWDATIYHALQDTMADVIRHVPFYHLECRPDDEAACVCRAQVYAS